MKHGERLRRQVKNSDKLVRADLGKPQHIRSGTQTLSVEVISDMALFAFDLVLYFVMEYFKDFSFVIPG